MNKLTISIVVAFFTIAGLLLVQATKTKAAAVLVPSELARQAAGAKLDRIRIAGRVAEGEVEYLVEPLITLKFRIADPGSETQGGTVPVVYHGAKPDMFGPGRDVIIDGEFSAGTVLANTLMTQCPSKYEPATATDAAAGENKQ